MKHTSGPWKIIDDNMEYIAITDLEQEFGICRLEEIASESRETMIANANLIAAAPEMLMALVKIQRIYNDFSGNAKVPIHEIRELIKIILKKARGEK